MFKNSTVYISSFMLIDHNWIALMIIVVDFNDKLSIFRTFFLGSKNL